MIADLLEGLSVELHSRLLRERFEGFERYNAWERQSAKEDLPDPATRFDWLEEVYELARFSGQDSWRREAIEARARRPRTGGAIEL